MFSSSFYFLLFICHRKWQNFFDISDSWISNFFLKEMETETAGEWSFKHWFIPDLMSFSFYRFHLKAFGLHYAYKACASTLMYHFLVFNISPKTSIIRPSCVFHINVKRIYLYKNWISMEYLLLIILITLLHSQFKLCLFFFIFTLFFYSIVFMIKHDGLNPEP